MYTNVLVYSVCAKAGKGVRYLIIILSTINIAHYGIDVEEEEFSLRKQGKQDLTHVTAL